MSSTTTRNLIGSDDIHFYDGKNETFTRQTSTGGLLTLNSVGHMVDVLEAYGAGTAYSSASIQSVISNVGLTNKRGLLLRPGTWAIDENLTIPANLPLFLPPGANLSVATGKTLTIVSPFEAGRYQVFSWTGTGAINLSGSPTTLIFPELFGAVAETSGWTQDNKAALAKMIASIAGQRQVVSFGHGWYRIASALPVGLGGNRWQGSGIFQSGIWIDIGGTGTGVTFGDGTTSGEAVEISDMSFLGPANCCEYGVDIRVGNPHINRVNFYMGCSEYALRTRSCEVHKMNMLSMPNNGNPTATSCPAAAYKVDTDPTTAWASDVADVRISTLGAFTKTVVSMEDAGPNISLSGAIQGSGVAAAPFAITDSGTIRLKDLYTEGLTEDAIITNSNVIIENPHFADATGYLRLVNCNSAHFSNGFIWNLHINAGCRGTTIDSLDYLNLVDDAPDTQWKGYYGNNSAYSYRSNKDKDKVNLWYNTSFNRWKADAPDGGWATGNTAWTKCGIGLADTTHHLSPFCAKMETDGGPNSQTITLDATQLSRVLGQVITHSLQLNFPTGQTLDDGVSAASARPFTWSIANTVPDWASGTYKINDAVKPTAAWKTAHPTYADNQVNQNMFVCTVAGTTGATEPNWGAGTVDAGSNVVITDGTVTWVVKPLNVDIYHANPYRATMQGNWHQDALHLFVPNNATAVTFAYGMAQQPDTSEATCYLAEPTLVVSNQTPTALVESIGEFQNYIQIGANKMDWGAAVPTTGYAAKGDIRWNSDGGAGAISGWKCTTAGNNDGTGTASVWQKLPVTAALP